MIELVGDLESIRSIRERRERGKKEIVGVVIGFTPYARFFYERRWHVLRGERERESLCFLSLESREREHLPRVVTADFQILDVILKFLVDFFEKSKSVIFLV